MSQYVSFIPLLPLIGFLLNGIFWKQMPKQLAGWIASGVMLIAFGLSLAVFFEVKANPGSPQIIHVFDFIKSGNLHIPFAFQVDELAALFLLIITGIGFLIHVYSTAYMKEDQGYVKYFAFLNFFVFSMLLLVLGANYGVMFIGWEGVGLASYLLIGFWYKNKEYTNASKKAFIMNRIGDLGFLVGMFLTIYNFGTLTFMDLFPNLQDGTAFEVGTGTMNAIAICFFIGAMGKSAQIPLYTWLPDAMAGPTPVSALIHAATMVTAGIYMIVRSNVLYDLAPLAQNLIAIIGLMTVLLAASIAMKQDDIKKVLAYSTVSQLGYMFLALGVGAYVGAVFHVMTHAFFKALLFLGSGSVIHAMSGEQDMRYMGGLGKKMKITQATFLIGCLAIAGIPGFSGFFSKDEILAAAFAKHPIYFALGLLGAMMTAFYMFRVYFLTFKGSFRGTEQQAHHVHESPFAMTFPLIVLAILSVVGGYIGLPPVISEQHGLANFLSPVVQNFGDLHLSHATEWILMGVSVTLIIVMILLARKCLNQPQFGPYQGFGKILENKWYVDELYQKVIIKPIGKLGIYLDQYVERKGIDGTVNGVGKFVDWFGGKLRLIQTGQVGFYLFGMVIGFVLIFIFGLWLF